jgi:septum site-determining protein MinD
VAEVIVITSGKGGVGKTTTSASFSTGLALQGKKTVVIDFDIGLRNLDLVMGVERRVVYDIANVINGEASLSQALIKDKKIPNLYILAASQTRDKDVLNKEGVGKIIEELSKDFDYIVCDSPAGIEKGALMAMYYADKAIVVTNPEVSSVRDSDRILGILASKTKRAEEGKEAISEHLLITRYSEKRANAGEMLSIEDVQDLLGIPLIGIIHESQAVLNASNKGEPVVLDADSDAGREYTEVVKRFLGKAPAFSLADLKQKKGFFRRIFRSQKEVVA